MKILLYLSLTLTLFFTSLLSAQDFKGIATYKSQRKMDIQLDSTQMNSDMQKQMMAMLKKQFEKEYTLEFTSNESIYKEVENLDKPSNMGSGGMQIVIAGSGEGDLLYKNIKENRFVNQSDLFGKIFLIKDTLNLPEWKLEKETKNIGEYTCFKATFTRMVAMSNSMTMTVNPEEEAEETEEKEVEQTVTAWYTVQIPVKHGPGNYSGLPGLILEVSDGSETILCSKIILNPKSGLNI
ncbi:MAG: GLPGLI family protein, partial [Bacteroidetes bacterium]|nr:GLPGLI family protein [Bacteroidota bacterium]